MAGQEEMMAAGGGGAGWPGSGLLSAAVRGISGMVQSFLTSSLNWEDFLEALHTPEQLKAFVNEHERAVGLHLLFLSQVLRVEPESALNGPHAAENFDRATFGIGQVISHEPAVASQMPCALTLVESLGGAVRYGWDVHHGVAKFAANSLVILATCSEAKGSVRVAALEAVYDGMRVWLDDTTERADGSDICGCSCSRPATSATCWVERLLTRPDDLVNEWFLEKADLEQWLVALVRAVREQHGNPFCITHLLQIDGMAARLMASDVIVECAERGPEPQREPEPEPEPEPETVLDRASLMPAQVAKTLQPIASDGSREVVPIPVDDVSKPLNRLTIGDDIMACLSFSVLTIEDSFFGEQAATALLNMAREPGGMDRLLSHSTSIPMLEGITTTACFHGAAIKLLAAVCDDERGRACLRSLVEALCEERAAEALTDTPENDNQMDKATGGVDENTDGSIDGTHKSGADEDAGEDGSVSGTGGDGEVDDEEHRHTEGDLPSWQRFKDRIHTTLRGVTAASLGAESIAGGGDTHIPRWPHHGLEPDLAKAFELTEILGENSEERQARLVDRMDTADKRMWLNQRLFRQHQGDQPEDELAEEPLAFIECDRDGCPVSEMRLQWEAKSGIGDDVSGLVEVRFKGESSVGSAVLREWMSHTVTAGYLNPKNNLLATNDGGRTFTLSPSRRETHPETYLLDFEIMGKFVGTALLHRVCVGMRFHPAFCRLILANNTAWAWTNDDVQEFDPLLYRNMIEYIRAADDDELADLELTFTDVQDWCADATDGKRVSPAVAQAVVDLATSGSDVAVTTANRAEYIDAVIKRRLFGSIEEQTAAFLSGLHTIVSPQIFSSLRDMVSPVELQELIAGLPTINPDDWKKNTQYGGGFSEQSQVVRWFWEAVFTSLFTSEELELILQFATGSRQTPAGGFAQLEGFNGGKHRFTLYKDSRKKPDALPTAHACLCTIDLPEYESRDQLVEKIRVAIVFGSVGMHDPAMADDGEAEEMATGSEVDEQEKEGQDVRETDAGPEMLQQ